MAYLMIKPVKTKVHLQQALAYIQNEEKTDNNFYVSSGLCLPENAYETFMAVNNERLRKSGNNLAHQIIQSFAPEDAVSPETAQAIGKKFIEKMFPDHQYVLATHIEKEHIHNHFIVCAVNCVTHKKIKSNTKLLDDMRRISDEVCTEYDLSVIIPTPKKLQVKLRRDIDDAVKRAHDWQNFVYVMKTLNYEIKSNDKYVYFKGEGYGGFIRNTTLGSAYSMFHLKARIEENYEVENKARTVYSNKPYYHRKRNILKADIENALFDSNTYAEFLELMSKKYDIKTGKHLALKSKEYGKRFIRLDSLEEEYHERMLRLYFYNKDLYKDIKHNLRVLRKNKKLRPASEIFGIYESIQNINLTIQTFNYLYENNIDCYNDLVTKICDLYHENAEFVIQKKNLRHKLSRNVSDNERERILDKISYIDGKILLNETKIKRLEQCKENIDRAAGLKPEEITPIIPPTIEPEEELEEEIEEEIEERPRRSRYYER